MKYFQKLKTLRRDEFDIELQVVATVDSLDNPLGSGVFKPPKGQYFIHAVAKDELKLLATAASNWSFEFSGDTTKQLCNEAEAALKACDTAFVAIAERVAKAEQAEDEPVSV